MEPTHNSDLHNELIWDILDYLLPEPSGYTTVSTLCKWTQELASRQLKSEIQQFNDNWKLIPIDEKRIFSIELVNLEVSVSDGYWVYFTATFPSGTIKWLYYLPWKCPQSVNRIEYKTYETGCEWLTRTYKRLDQLLLQENGLKLLPQGNALSIYCMCGKCGKCRMISGAYPTPRILELKYVGYCESKDEYLYEITYQLVDDIIHRGSVFYNQLSGKFSNITDLNDMQAYPAMRLDYDGDDEEPTIEGNYQWLLRQLIIEKKLPISRCEHILWIDGCV